MPKDEIEKTITLVRERLDAYQEEIRLQRTNHRLNETRTRYCLIDPLLRACGWDLCEPSETELEAKLAGGRIDYVLKDSTGKRSIFIEAKGLGVTRVRNRRVPQLLNYVKDEPHGVAVLTDGNHWVIYDLAASATEEASFSVSETLVHQSVAIAYQWLDKTSWQ